MKSDPFRRLVILLAVLAAMVIVPVIAPLEAISSCSSPSNAIEAENCLPGTPQSTWDIPSRDAGDPSIQGFATDISVNQGATVFFKVNTPAGAWRLDIYRMGYYGGNGARKVATVNPSVALPQSQPVCVYDVATGLTDCGNWAVSASWTVPANATSGIYFAKAIRTDTGGSSHIFFIVRNDASHSDILFQTSDTSWQAYNDYSQNFYGCNGTFNSNCRAYKISYNRPFHTRSFEPQTWVFNAEYPMVRWLETNSYDVTYFTGVDTDRNGSLILKHKIWISNGHDEYWSGNQRTKVEAARAAGVHLAFFSGNSVFWKTRWENSIDGSGTPYRTLVCYKETWANAIIDPADPPTWTGTWRDPRFSPPADGGRPENALAGTLTLIAGGYDGDMTVPRDDGRMRFWRNTSIASLPPGQTVTLAQGTLGEELDVDEDTVFRPAGLFHLTTTPVTSNDCLIDYGTVVGTCNTVHNMTQYRYSSGALVFAAGTYDWAWGLDANHDRSALGSITDDRMQQATVNLFADMGVQPATIQPGLAAATASTDHTPPTATITSPLSGSFVFYGSTTTITGTAADTGGGVVGGVEVSTDNGATWHPAMGRENWSYAWKVRGGGSATILSRAVDDSGNLGTSLSGVSVTISGGSNGTTIWPGSTVPGTIDAGPDWSVELGVKFRADSNGNITGVRFYKASANTGTHSGSLWTSTGTLLATATFTNETSSGWQQATFSTPVAITPNTVYVASYHTSVGHYSVDENYFASNGVDSPPLHFLADGMAGANGVFTYGAISVFPTQGSNGSNYWVDVVFSPTSQPPPPPTLSSITVTPGNQTILTGVTQQFTATGTFSDGSTQNITGQTTWTSTNRSVATITSSGLATAVGPGSTSILAVLNGITGSTNLTVQVGPLTITTPSLSGGTLNVSYSATLAASGGTLPYTWSIASGSLPTGLSLNGGTGVISGTPTATGIFNFTVQVTDSGNPTQSTTKALSITVAAQATYTIWPGATVPGTIDAGPDSAVELGVKFRADSNGYIMGLRFHKASTNTGTHVGNLWTSTGTLLTTATFTGETASGWQQLNFSTPVAITANTVYVASYHTNVGHYSDDLNYFAGKGVDSPPLHALADGVSGFDGVFAYGSTSSFPNQGWNSSNYWVDVVFSATPPPPPTLSSITVTPANQTISIGATQQFTATGTFSDGSTQNITSQTTWASSNTSAATITSSGLATAVNPGITSISATLNGVTGSTNLTVQASPLTITTASLSGGTVNVPYSATLAASGGTIPYTWSIASGSLPTGLSLNSGTGVISGTPTAAGAFNFAVQVADSGNPMQSITKALSITVVTQTSFTIWPGTTVPGIVDSGPDKAVELGVKFRADSNGYIKGIRFYKASTNAGTHVGNLWTSTGTRLATATFTGETASGWQQVNFATSVAITANTVYVASYHTNTGHYSDDFNYFAGKGVDSPPLHALADGVSSFDGAYAYGSTSKFPNLGWMSSNYWVDVVFSLTR